MPRALIRRAGEIAVASVKWSCRQARGFARNVWSVVGDRERVLPTPVQQTWQQLKGAIPQAFGVRGTAQDQIVSSVLLATISIASSVVTAGATLALVAVFAVTAGVGVLRLIPAVGDRFDSGRDTVSPSSGGERSWRGRR